MDMTVRSLLIIGIGAVIAYYVAGPVGIGVLALFFLLKKAD